jgi:hypothetical protein
MGIDIVTGRRVGPRRMLGLGLLLAAAVATGLPLAARADGRGDPLVSACGVKVRSFVAPSAVKLGELVTVMDDVVFSCPLRRRPLHVAVVAPWPPPAEADRVVAGLGEALNLGGNALVAAGLVGYADTAGLLCAVRPGDGQWAECLDDSRRRAATGKGSAGLAEAIYQGWKALAMARLGQAEEPLREVMAVLLPTEAPAPGLCAAARAELAAARDDGIDVSLLCPTGGCPMDCISAGVPSDRRPPAETFNSLAGRLATLAQASEQRAAWLTLRETIPPEFEVDESSMDPPATSGIPGAFTWHLSVPPSGEVAIRFSARARRTGNLVVAEAAYLAFTDSIGRSGGKVLDARRVSVGWLALLPVGLREGRDLKP